MEIGLRPIYDAAGSIVDLAPHVGDSRARALKAELYPCPRITGGQ